MIEIQAPHPLIYPENYLSCFVAGSIELGKAINFQRELVNSFQGKDIAFFNPRRDDFDPYAKQVIENDYFRGQVEWELDALDRANLIVMYFDPNTKSPISLLELGLHAKSKKLIVCCPEGFWRKGNVDIVCRRYGIEQVETFEELVEAIKKRIL